MATRSLRNRTSSRFSSPAVAVDNEVREPPAEAMDEVKEEEDPSEWREPPVRTLPPSYKDHKGLERLGVLELQQPLGVPPSQKLLQRLKLNFNRPSNRATPLPEDEIMSQDVDSEVAEVGSSMDVEGPTGETDIMAVSSPPRGRPPNRDTAEMRMNGPGESTPSPVKSTVSGTNAGEYKPTSIQEHLRQERVMNYVSRAVTEAQERGDWGLVPGLEKIRKNANDKRELWIVLEAIAHQNPTPEQLHIFKKFIKRGVKRHRRDSALSSSAPSTGIAGEGILGPDGVRHSSLHGEAVSTFTSPFRTRPSSSGFNRSQPASPSSRRQRMDAVEESRLTDKNSRRRRSRSNSTSSSLSSAKSIPEHFQPAELRVDEAGDNERQVRSGRRQAGDRHAASAPSGRSARHANNNSSITTSDKDSPFNPSSNKVISEKLKKAQHAREEVEAEYAEIERRRKRLLRESEVDYNYRHRDTVNERHQIRQRRGDDDLSANAADDDYPRPPVVHSRPAKVLKFPRLRQTATPTLMNGTSRKRAYDEFDDDDDDENSSDALTPLSSSPVPPFAPPPPPGAERSRAATPRASTRGQGPITKVARKSARVLVSPNKPKNGGITAGFNRAGAGNKLAELGNGADSSQEDNDEFCASCGGEGKLLCCDGCTNSFHHACLEPPLNPDEEVDGEWFCPQCQAKRMKNTEDSKSMLAKALRALDHAIPRAFALPHAVREYFEGVRTGEEGEYTEFGQPRTQSAPKMNRAGFIEEPNYKEPRDPKGNLNLCKGCGLGANGKDLIPCDFCEAKWHLDCVDPPLAVPPRRRAGDKPNASWRCPLHIDQDLVGLGRQVEAAPGDLGGHPRVRKPKNAKPVDVDFPRGFRNNGVIEVELSEDAPSIRELDLHGTIYRLPEQAIRLDFIDRVKRSWYEDTTFPDTVNGRPARFRNRDYRPRDPAVLHEPKQMTITIKEPEFYKGSHALSIVETAKANAALRRKTLPEQQAIISLSKMARAEENEAYGDALAELTNAIVAEAPDQAGEMLNGNEKRQLQRLQTLIERRIRILDGRDGIVAQALSGNRQKDDNRYFSPGTHIPERRGGIRVPKGPDVRDVHPNIQQETFTPVQYYAPVDPNYMYPGQPVPYPTYAGPPPPHTWGPGYAYPPGPAFGQWQAQIPPASSPSKSPYAPQPQPVFTSNQGSPVGIQPSLNPGQKPPTPGQSLLQNMPPFYGPSPPQPHVTPSQGQDGAGVTNKSSGASSRRGSALNNDAGSTPSADQPPAANGADALIDPALFDGGAAAIQNKAQTEPGASTNKDAVTPTTETNAAAQNPTNASGDDVMDDAWIYGPSPADDITAMLDGTAARATSSTQPSANASGSDRSSSNGPRYAIDNGYLSKDPSGSELLKAMYSQSRTSKSASPEKDGSGKEMVQQQQNASTFNSNPNHASNSEDVEMADDDGGGEDSAAPTSRKSAGLVGLDGSSEADDDVLVVQELGKGVREESVEL